MHTCVHFFTCIQEHTGRVFSLQFDNFQIVSGSHDDTILIWDFSHPKPEERDIGEATEKEAIGGGPSQQALHKESSDKLDLPTDEDVHILIPGDDHSSPSFTDVDHISDTENGDRETRGKDLSQQSRDQKLSKEPDSPIAEEVIST